MGKKVNDTDYTVDSAPESTAEEGGAFIAQPAPASATPSTRVIYIGPNIPGGILQRFQVFKGGLPPYCEDLSKKIPEIRELFVPVEGLEAIRRKIEELGTNEARLFYAVQTALNKGVK
jgi:hypothetical protein